MDVFLTPRFNRQLKQNSDGTFFLRPPAVVIKYPCYLEFQKISYI